jgi:hypothetical protein
MREIKVSPFRRMRGLEILIEEFLDQVSKAALAFEQGMGFYLDKGAGEDVDQKLDQITKLERQGDDIQLRIVSTLLAKMLIPDSRADVLILLDELDELLDTLKSNFLTFAIERPQIPEELEDDVRQLTTAVVHCVESAVMAARAYFRNVQMLRDHLHKVDFYEGEADRLAIRLRKRAFSSDLPLERKMHLTSALRAVAFVSDVAERVGDRLAVYAAKQAL